MQATCLPDCELPRQPSPHKHASRDPKSSDDSVQEAEKPRRHFIHAGRNGDVDPERNGRREREPPRDDEANNEADDYEKR